MMFRHQSFYLLCLLIPAFLWPAADGSAQRRITDRIDPVEELDRAKGTAFLDEFRRMGIQAGYKFEFRLRTMPLRGAERLYDGRMWGSRNQWGPVTLFEIEARDDPENRIRLLVQNGTKRAIWKAVPGDDEGYAVSRVRKEDWFLPIMGTDYTPFDLQMPFVFWEDFDYEGVYRVRGRPCHVFRMNPPESFRAEHSGLSSVQIYLDSEFKALFRAESLDEANEPNRVFSVIDFKKVQDEWIVKTIDLRDERTRDKTRFQVERAAMNVDLPSSAFDPRNLADELPELDPDRFSRVN